MMEPSKRIQPVTGEAAAEDGDGKDEGEEQSKNCEDEGKGRLGLLFNLVLLLLGNPRPLAKS